MSDYTRYLLASAGIEATDEEVAALDASGYAYQIVGVISSFRNDRLWEGWTMTMQFKDSVKKIQNMAGHSQEQIDAMCQALQNEYERS